MGPKQSVKYSVTKLLLSLEMIYYATPVRLRRLFWPARLVFWFIQILRMEQWIITGDEAASKQELAIVYTGSEKNKNFLIRLAFNGSCRETYVGKKWLWQTLETVNRRSCDCSLMINEVPKAFRALFQRKKYFYVPCWISAEVDISAGISSLIKNESLKSDLRKIMKHRLHFEVTNELSQFHNFYYNMHLPYITRVHGKEASIMNYASMKKDFRNRTLLLIRKGEECIAGIFLDCTNKVASLRSLGIRAGNSDHVKKDGAIGALFYFSVQYLQENGFTRVNFGGSRAFFKDGVLRYKRKWDPKVVDECQRAFLIRPLSKTAGVKGFLLNNPFIYVDKMRLYGAVFVEADQSLSKEGCGKIYHDYYQKGMTKLVVYRFGQNDSTVLETVPPEFSDGMTIRSAESLF